MELVYLSWYVEEPQSYAPVNQTDVGTYEIVVNGTKNYYALSSSNNFTSSVGDLPVGRWNYVFKVNGEVRQYGIVECKSVFDTLKTSTVDQLRARLDKINARIDQRVEVDQASFGVEDHQVQRESLQTLIKLRDDTLRQLQAARRTEARSRGEKVGFFGKIRINNNGGL